MKSEMPHWYDMIGEVGNNGGHGRSRFVAPPPNTGNGRRDGRDRISLLQSQSQRPSFLSQRGFVSPRNFMRLATSYEVDDESDSSSILPGYIPPGTHSIPSSTYSRKPTPRPGRPGPSATGHGSGFLSTLGRKRYGPGFNNLGPIFPENEDEDSFFPSETLPPIDEGFLHDYGGYSSNFPDPEDDRSREKFEERLSSFPEVPLDAHRRIFQMGNEIVDCFEVRLERFYRGSLLDSVSECVAVFTKKERTGQRWLMVFKEEAARTVIKFNRLLTHSLLVSVVSSTAIEVEAAKSLYGPPSEMCVINFMTTDDASRFYKTLQESQATAWNHREVTHEQKMKTLFTKINVAIAQADLMGVNNIPINPENLARRTVPVDSFNNATRTPFTLLKDRDMHKGMRDRELRCRNLRDREEREMDMREKCGILTNSFRKLYTTKATRPSQSETAVHISDLDDDWRSKNCGDGSEFFASVGTRTPHHFMDQQARIAKKCVSVPSTKLSYGGLPPVRPVKTFEPPLAKSSPSQFAFQTYPNDNSRDGSGDTEHLLFGQGHKADDECFSEDIVFEEFVTVFMKIDSDYTEVGTGTLQLLDHKDYALDELRLIGEHNKETLQQYIYKWNVAEKVSDEKTKTCVCLWDGAVSFADESEVAPERRQFKVRLSSEDDADVFLDSFLKSVDKAKDEDIRKRHICWYLQNKREYKTPQTNGDLHVSPSSTN